MYFILDFLNSFASRWKSEYKPISIDYTRKPYNWFLVEAVFYNGHKYKTKTILNTQSEKLTKDTIKHFEKEHYLINPLINK